MSKLFKIRASATHKIMGAIGLTATQEKKRAELVFRKETKDNLTEKMQADLDALQYTFKNPQLPQTAKTYLEEWYANDDEEIYSKYMAKGNDVENELIDFMADMLGLGLADKNKVSMSDEFFTGSCDVETTDTIIDVKAPWNKKTLQRAAVSKIDEGYDSQIKVYCHLWQKEKGVLFYGLMDTPDSVNYGNEVVYSELPDSQRWVAFEVKADPKFIDSVIERVKMCREYLAQYELEVSNKLGKIVKL
jgi:hypothetical protein